VTDARSHRRQAVPFFPKAAPTATTIWSARSSWVNRNNTLGSECLDTRPPMHRETLACRPVQDRADVVAAVGSLSRIGDDQSTGANVLIADQMRAIIGRLSAGSM
jgi:hypothetical protein